MKIYYQLVSKLNGLQAQRQNYRSCGHFSEEEILKHQAKLDIEIAKTKTAMETASASSIETTYELVNPN